MKKKKQALSKENFIDFIIHASQEDLNDLIRNKGKQKLYNPIYTFRSEDSFEDKKS